MLERCGGIDVGVWDRCIWMCMCVRVRVCMCVCVTLLKSTPTASLVLFCCILFITQQNSGMLVRVLHPNTCIPRTGRSVHDLATIVQRALSGKYYILPWGREYQLPSSETARLAGRAQYICVS